MRYFSIEFEWRSRPMYRKGRARSCVLTFGAEDQTQAYELAKAEGERRFSRHKWKVIGCTELTVPERFKEAHERQSDSHDGSARRERC